MLFQDVGKGRKQLETYHFDFNSTTDIVDGVSLLQELKKSSKDWSAALDLQKNVEKLLQRQRFFFSPDWLYSDRVQGEYSAFDQILKRRLEKMQENAQVIQGKISVEDLALDSRIKEFAADWKKNRPVSGAQEHQLVTQKMNMFESTLQRLEEESARMLRAKKALEMPFKEEVRLQPIREEVSGLKEVWDQMAKQWQELDELGEKRLMDLEARKLRKALEKMQTGVQSLPSYMRQYEAYEYLK